MNLCYERKWKKYIIQHKIEKQHIDKNNAALEKISYILINLNLFIIRFGFSVRVLTWMKNCYRKNWNLTQSLPFVFFCAVLKYVISLRKFAWKHCVVFIILVNLMCHNVHFIQLNTRIFSRVQLCGKINIMYEPI